LNNVGKLRTAYADSDITLWLSDSSESNERALIHGLQDVSGVTEIYAKRDAGNGLPLRTGLHEPGAAGRRISILGEQAQ
jgi:hypothetical protein